MAMIEHQAKAGPAATPIAWQLAGYEPLRELGRGRSGVVYLCREHASGRQVAVKRLLGPTTDHISARRLRRERRLLSRLHHPGIVGVYDLLSEGGELCLVLEYVPGSTLLELLHSSPLAPSDSLEVLRQLAAALEHAHERHVVHRDLTPANVLVTPSGECKLADFGIAKLTGETTSRSLMSFRTRTGAIIGTAAYISPEAAAGTTRLDRRADLYSLGVLAYELLLGRPPFPAGPDPLQTLEAHISRAVPRPTRLSPGFPEEVETVLLCALAKRARQRQPNAQVFWNQLDRAATAAWPDWREQADLRRAISKAGPGTYTPAPADGGAHEPTLIESEAPPARPLQRIPATVFHPRKTRRWITLLAAVIAGMLAAALVILIGQIR